VVLVADIDGDVEGKGKVLTRRYVRNVKMIFERGGVE
jgi:hypothetical protein